MLAPSENKGERAIGKMAARTLVLGALAGLVAACNPTFTNTAAVFPVVSGAADVKVNITAPGVKLVEFTLDGAPVGQDTDPTDGYSVEVDSTQYPNGLRVVRATARDSAGTALQTIEHTLLFQN